VRRWQRKRMVICDGSWTAIIRVNHVENLQTEKCLRWEKHNLLGARFKIEVGVEHSSSPGMGESRKSPFDTLLVGSPKEAPPWCSSGLQNLVQCFHVYFGKTQKNLALEGRDIEQKAGGSSGNFLSSVKKMTEGPVVRHSIILWSI